MVSARAPTECHDGTVGHKQGGRECCTLGVSVRDCSGWSVIVKQECNLALSILSALDIAVLRRTGERQYVLYGSVPEFYKRLFSTENGEPSVTPWRHSDMLEFFLDDAEAFFSRSQGSSVGTLSSGVWQEEGVQAGKLALLATAMCLESEQILIIRLLSDDFIDRRRILQKAREHLLERRSHVPGKRTDTDNPSSFG